ncbi:acetylglutamate kinase [Peribacillus alkalitolerans]|uniref:acetylglutamate kinase n=1 Tax=Peribacillus alkalitolerans TaxID=1550385 RepID=UPI0013D2E0DA|nr:acetylglutamate kinase [Peribacillus alkalitolerans]
MATYVIKLGGSIIHDLTPDFFTSLQELKRNGHQLVFVHGGGPDISAMLDKMGVQAEFSNGLRVTTKEVMEVVELMLAGKTNRLLTSLLDQNDIPSIGLNGSDANFLTGEFVDYPVLGYVGTITNVEIKRLMMVIKEGWTPVISPIAITSTGQKLNVNADMAAGAIAQAIKADALLFVTDVQGVIKDGQLLHSLSEHQVMEFINEGIIYGGMIPKVKTALKATEIGVNEVVIVSGTNEFFENGCLVGTSFTKGENITI